MNTNNTQPTKIAIITRRFFPHGDASSEVIKNFTEELLKNNFSVRVFSPTDIKEDENTKRINGIDITNVYSPETISFSQLKQKIKAHPFSYLPVLITKTIHFIIQKTIDPYRSLSLNYSLVKSYYQILEIFVHMKTFYMIIKQIEKSQIVQFMDL